MYKILDLSTGEYVMTCWGSIDGTYIYAEPVKEFEYITYARRYLHDMVWYYRRAERLNKKQFEIIKV